MGRIFLIHSLCRYGERLLRLEELSLNAIKETTEHWKSFEGKPFDPQQSIHDLVARIITTLVSKYSNWMIHQKKFIFYDGMNAHNT